MEDKEYYSVSEYQTYNEYKSFKAEQYKVKENALEKMKDSFKVEEDSSNKEYQRKNKANDEVLAEKEESNNKIIIEEEIKKIDKIQSAITQTSATITSSAASIAGGVAATAAAAAIVVVTSATIMSRAPKVNLVDFEVGVDYLAYEIKLEDIDENLDYKLIITNPYQTFEYEIEPNNLYRKDIIGGLRPNLQYDFKLVANDDTLGETVYFTKSFYTLKGSNPELKANYDFVSNFENLTYDFEFDFYISDYYNNGSEYKLSFFNNEKLVYETDLLDDSNHFTGKIEDLTEGNLKYIVSAKVYEEVTDLANQTIDVVYPSDLSEAIDNYKIPRVNNVIFENSSMNYHISAKHNLFKYDNVYPIIVFTQYSSDGEIINVSEEEATTSEDNLFYGNAIFERTTFISYVIKCEYNGEEIELYKQEKIQINTDDSSEYSFELNENEIDYVFSRDLTKVFVTVPIKYHSDYEMYYAAVVTIYSPDGEVLGEYNSDYDESNVIEIDYVSDVIKVEAGVKKYYDNNPKVKVFCSKTITLDQNSHRAISLESTNEGKDILISGIYSNSFELFPVITLKFYDKDETLLTTINRDLLVKENGEFEQSFPSVIVDDADHYELSLYEGDACKYSTGRIEIDKSPYAKILSGVVAIHDSAPQIPITIIKYDDYTSIEKVEVSIYDDDENLIYSGEARYNIQNDEYIFNIDADINIYESINTRIKTTYFDKPGSSNPLEKEMESINIPLDSSKPVLLEPRIEIVEFNPILKFTYDNEGGNEQYIDGNVTITTLDGEVIKTLQVELDDQNDAKIDIGVDCADYSSFNFEIVLNYKAKYGNYTHGITSTNTYVNSYVIEPRIVIKDNEYSIIIDRYIPSNANVYVSINGEDEMIVDRQGLTGTLVEDTGTIDYFYKIDDDRFGEVIVNYNSQIDRDSLDYLFTAVNPGDAFVTFNVDGTYNLRLFTNFQNLTTDKDIYYRVVGTSGDETFDVVNSGTEAWISNVPIGNNIYFGYYVYLYQDGVNYQLDCTMPSGGIESVTDFSREFYAMYAQETGNVEIYLYNIEFDSLSVNVDGNEYAVVWGEDSEYFDSENMKITIGSSNPSGLITIEGKANKYYKDEGHEVPLGEEKYIEFSLEIKYGG